MMVRCARRFALTRLTFSDVSVPSPDSRVACASQAMHVVELGGSRDEGAPLARATNVGTRSVSTVRVPCRVACGVGALTVRLGDGAGLAAIVVAMRCVAAPALKRGWPLFVIAEGVGVASFAVWL